MVQPRVQLMVVWMALAACGFGICHTLYASAGQPPEILPSTQLNSTDGSRSTDQSAGRQMEALQSHARTRMILYQGRFEQVDHAQLKRELDAVALMLKRIERGPAAQD